MRPPSVISDMGFQGAHQRATFSFRAQGRINFKEALGTDADKLPRQARDLRVRRLAHKDDVDVRNVVKLACATLAHGDNR